MPQLLSPSLGTGHELILNACEGALQIALTSDEKPVCFQEWFEPRRATEILAPALADIFAKTGIAAASIRRVACVAGPGSFTGIRLVLATAAALRRAGIAQLASLDYLQALATSAAMRRAANFGEKIFVITHARRDLVHFQEFSAFGPIIPAYATAEAQLLAPRAALAAIGARTCLVCGSALARHADVFAPPGSGQGSAGAPNAIMLPGLIHPDLAALCLLARHGDYFPADVQPKYVRGCDAAENLEANAAADSEAAQAMRHYLEKAPKSEI